jgi:hypothetical protein
MVMAMTKTDVQSDMNIICSYVQVVCPIKAGYASI